MQDLTGGPATSGILKHLHAAELGSLLLFQLLPHFLIAVSVLVHPETFSAKVMFPSLIEPYVNPDAVFASQQQPLSILCHGVLHSTEHSTSHLLRSVSYGFAVLLCNCDSGMRLHQRLQCAQGCCLPSPAPQAAQ